ncbi:hypothetical protein Pyn_10893 [Prunus yedoensis var. nudiflora]|uniref:Uncharacterized protein n=1 Tax=Prunus yedoensis var. nudiflora TaxID=2094558 RepID=A0A314YNT1_PRUYE|nr:hypothetical protein Pyn_10893 [Prunus yedoensis var. nudiflora]
MEVGNEPTMHLRLDLRMDSRLDSMMDSRLDSMMDLRQEPGLGPGARDGFRGGFGADFLARYVTGVKKRLKSEVEHIGSLFQKLGGIECGLYYIFFSLWVIKDYHSRALQTL